MAKNQNIIFKVDEETKKGFQESCEKNWSSMSHVLNQFVHKYIAEHHPDSRNNGK